MPSDRPTLVFYVTGHGFGHASRTIEVINAVGVGRPDAAIHVRTSAARWLFDATVRVPAAFTAVSTDVGVIQRDSLRLDIPATVEAARAFYGRFADFARDEAAVLLELGATAVVGDIPPLAFEAAALAGVPGIALGNFTWDWIYDAYPEMHAGAPEVFETIRHAHSKVTAALRLPMWGGFDGWPCPIEDVPFVARHSRRDPADVRHRLRVPPGHRLVLTSFGGLGLDGLDVARLAGLEGWTILTTGHGMTFAGQLPPHMIVLPDRGVYEMGLRYEDLVRAADVVVTKPGYGIIAECLANHTALLYTSRGAFAEYDVLVAAMPRYLRCAYIEQRDLYAGLWAAHLDALVAQPAPEERPPTNGAEVAAARILGGVL